MNNENPTQSTEETFAWISDLSDDAEWTNEELKEALRSEGIDPDQAVARLTKQIKGLLAHSPTLPQDESKAIPSAILSQSPLAGLRQHTGKMASVITAALGVTAAFLRDIGRNSNVLPMRAKTELARRAEEKVCQGGSKIVLDSFASTYQEQMAASRVGGYENEEVDYETIIARSGLPESEKDFWRSLAGQEVK